MFKWKRLLAVSALTLFMVGGVSVIQPASITAQAALTKAQKKAKLKKAKAKKLRQEKKHYTTSEWSQVTKYRKQAKQIGMTAKGMYAQKPILKKHFRPGKLSNSYVNRTVNWVNFYRSMFGLSKVTADSAWNQSAQMGAANLAAGKGVSHGLVGLKRPSYVSKQDWQTGADATNQSNLSGGTNSPYDIVTGYLSDDCDLAGLEPGHRLWLLGGIDKIGVGQVGHYNDLRVFEKGVYAPKSEVKPMAFPKAGLMPYALVGNGAPWSVSFDGHQDNSKLKPRVRVYDKTAKKNVPVTHVNETSSAYGYGFFGTNVYFLPKKSLVKVNHAYTVKISGIVNQADVSYQTRLFDLKVSGKFY